VESRLDQSQEENWNRSWTRRELVQFVRSSVTDLARRTEGTKDPGGDRESLGEALEKERERERERERDRERSSSSSSRRGARREIERGGGQKQREREREKRTPAERKGERERRTAG